MISSLISIVTLVKVMKTFLLETDKLLISLIFVLFIDKFFDKNNSYYWIHRIFRPIVQVELPKMPTCQSTALAVVISDSKNVRLFNLDADSRACTLALSITRQLPAALRLSAGLRWRSRVVLDAADRRARLKYFPW